MSALPMTFVCWKWRPPLGYRSTFGPETVNVLLSMLTRTYRAPFELVCVTDDPSGIDTQVRIVPLWSDFANMVSPHGRGYPSCYRRLKMFSREAASFLGARIVSMDLDVVIVADITALFENGLDFKMYGDTAKSTPYNGSLIQLTAGARPQLWEQFDPKVSPLLGLKKNYIGSDQAWIGVCLGPNEAKFTARDGIYSYRNEIAPRGGFLPPDAKIVIMHGNVDPWNPAMKRRHTWIQEHYR